ncbi:hypothetical protein A6035_06990 [Dietzia lutea]|uniref:DUF732 domain-containing protein n=1 Tax=Dietzia lutea TaxID=546160 RepID=A0A2S1R6M8_9ACTN|nr:hypothetical protein A6035_06990 [Dietzia lutea]
MLAAAALLAATAAAAACGDGADGSDGDGITTAAAPETVASDTSGGARPGTGGPLRTEEERAFLADLAGLGLPTEMTAETTLEVGLGICRGIDDGADTEMILDRIRPLTSAIASQNDEWDTAGVGRALIDASRTRLCD